MIVARKDPDKCPKCSSSNLRQEDDVLDTWFSSWLWPFSTLGWPENTDDMKKFFPTSTLVTAYDIIFFWVARMIMASLEFTGQVPFKDIYIHGLVRAKDGRKMSKSLGNGIDPLDVVAEYGADAFKFTLSFLAAQGQDILIDMESFKFGSKFANKIWNASRYLLMNIEGRNLIEFDKIEKNSCDKWILNQMNEAVASVEKAMKSYRFNDAAKAVYEFFWNDFCDWYIEASKLSLYSDNESEKDRGISILIHVLNDSLKLLHPFLPFITEEIYQKLSLETGSIVNASYPEYKKENSAPELASNFESIQELIKAVRTMRSEFQVAPSKKIKMFICPDEGFRASSFFEEQSELIKFLVSASEIEYIASKPEDKGFIPVAGNGFEVYVSLKDVIDIPKEIAKLKKDIEKQEKLLKRTEGKLSNSSFLDKAPEEIIQKEKAAKEELSQMIEKMKQNLIELSE